MAWKGIVGIGMSVDQFRDQVAGLKFASWRPSFLTLHNTGAPKLSQWHPAASRMCNIEPPTVVPISLDTQGSMIRRSQHEAARRDVLNVADPCNYATTCRSPRMANDSRRGCAR